MGEWYSLWGQAHSPIPQKNYVRENQTLSMWFIAGLSGNKLRLRMENQSKEKATQIGEAAIFVGGKRYKVLFGEKKSTEIPPHSDFYSEEISVDVAAGMPVEIRIFYPDGCKFTTGGRTFAAVTVSGKGNHTDGAWVEGGKKPFRRIMSTLDNRGDVEATIPTLGGVEIYSDHAKGSIVAFGDSITQHGTWVRALAQRLLKEKKGQYSVINKGIGGNRLLYDAQKLDAYGDAGMKRFRHDILMEQNVKIVIFALGTNDLGLPGKGLLSAPPAEMPTVKQYAKAVKELTDELHAAGIRVIGTTILPREKPVGFLLNKMMDYTDRQEALRQSVNAWLRMTDVFDGLFDFDIFAKHPYKQALRQEMNRGDGLHLSHYGGILLAGEMDLDLLCK